MWDLVFIALHPCRQTQVWNVMPPRQSFLAWTLDLESLRRYRDRWMDCGLDLERMGMKEIRRGFWKRKKGRCFGRVDFGSAPWLWICTPPPVERRFLLQLSAEIRFPTLLGPCFSWHEPCTDPHRELLSESSSLVFSFSVFSSPTSVFFIRSKETASPVLSHQGFFGDVTWSVHTF